MDTKKELHRKYNEAITAIHILDVNGEDMLRKDLLTDLYGEQFLTKYPSFEARDHKGCCAEPDYEPCET